MATEADPYEVLGVARGATLEAIKLAYRRAALKYHPDNCRGDQAEAIRRFRELTDAYRRASRLAGRTLTPEELTHLTAGWSFVTAEGVGRAAHKQWRARPGTQKLSVATRNEQKTFVYFWVMAIVLAVVVGYVTVEFRLISQLRRELEAADIGITVGLALGVYAAVVAATVFLLILTRKIVYLIFRLGLRGLRTLPGADEQRTLPSA